MKMWYMMVKYTGCFSRYEIERFKPPPNSVLVCIHDPDTWYPKVSRIDMGWSRITFHRFWDVTSPNNIGDKIFEPASEKELLRVNEALQWALEDKRHIFASCEAGISRSSAVREYLVRHHEYQLYKGQKDRAVYPNIHVLTSLERLNSKTPLFSERITNVASC